MVGREINQPQPGLQHILRLLALGDILPLGNGGKWSLAVGRKHGGRVPQHSADGAIHVLNVNFDRFPVFAGERFLDELHGVMNLVRREE